MSTPARLLAVATSTLVLVLASAATATAAEPVGSGWEHDGYSGLQYLGLLVGAPVLLMVVIWLLALLTARRNFVPVEAGVAKEHGRREVEPHAPQTDSKRPASDH